jgi:hypothetical protein
MNLIKTIKRMISYDINEKHLYNFFKSCDDYLNANEIEKKKIIIWPTPFNLHKYYWTHDGIVDPINETMC